MLFVELLENEDTADLCELEAEIEEFVREPKHAYEVVYGRLFREIPADSRSPDGKHLYYGLRRSHRSETRERVERYLRQFGWRIDSWPEAVAVDAAGRRRKIVPLLRSLAEQGRIEPEIADEIARRVENDPARAKGRDTDLLVVISRDPRDLVTAGTKRRWQSCLDLSKTSPMDRAYARTLINQALERLEITAWLTTADDPNLEKPLARQRIVPLVDDKGRIVLEFSENTYGIPNRDFVRFVEEWMEQASRRLINDPPEIPGISERNFPKPYRFRVQSLKSGRFDISDILRMIVEIAKSGRTREGFDKHDLPQLFFDVERYLKRAKSPHELARITADLPRLVPALAIAERTRSAIETTASFVLGFLTGEVPPGNAARAAGALWRAALRNESPPVSVFRGAEPARLWDNLQDRSSGLPPDPDVIEAFIAALRKVTELPEDEFRRVMGRSGPTHGASLALAVARFDPEVARRLAKRLSEGPLRIPPERMRKLKALLRDPRSATEDDAIDAWETGIATRDTRDRLIRDVARLGRIAGPLAESYRSWKTTTPLDFARLLLSVLTRADERRWRRLIELIADELSPLRRPNLFFYVRPNKRRLAFQKAVTAARKRRPDLLPVG